MIRLAVRVARAQAEPVLAELLELVPGGLEERDVDDDTVEYALYGAPGELPDVGELRAVAGGALVDVSTSEVSDGSDWRDWHRPLDVGPLRVRAPWAPERPGALDVVIDPGQAFGTGAHPSTRLTLALLAGLPPGGPLADWGCGSGILAVAAVRLGFDPVLACDHEREAVAATLAAAEANGVELTATRCDLRRAAGPFAPTVLANLVAAAAARDRRADGAPAGAADRLRADAGRGRRRGGGLRGPRPPPGVAPRRRRLVRHPAGAMISLDDVQAAARRIDGVAHRTPVLTSRALDEATGATVFLKAENLQRAGAFKFRGAYNAVASLSDEERARGVATVSSGNHAQALSLAAKLHGIPAVILMPEDSPAGKLAATEGYGAEIIRFDRYGQDREQLLAELVAERGLVPGPSVRRRARDGRAGHRGARADRAGRPARRAARADRRRRADQRLRDGRRGERRSASSAWSPRRVTTSSCSLEAGERVRIDVPRTIADGQQLPTPGELTFEVIRERVDEVVLASDPEIVEAMRFLFERMKTVAEPSGACALAALLAGRVPASRVGVVISGGNVTAERFSGLVASGQWPGTS